jgi:Amt family ammonium transporter
VGGYIIYGVIKALIGIRLTAEEEQQGADLSIHKISSTADD